MLVVGSIVLAIAATVLHGWVLKVLWEWLAVPMFGLDPISIAQALALMCLAKLFMWSLPDEKEGESKEQRLIRSGFSLVFMSLGTLVIVWILRGWF